MTTKKQSKTHGPDLQNLVTGFLRAKGPVLSHDLAYEFCREQGVKSQQAATQIIKLSWHVIFNKRTKQNQSKPIVFIIGPGAGAPRVQALRNVRANIFNRVLCIYDVTGSSLSTINNLIEACHQKLQPAVVILISEPLADSARRFIEESTLANVVPSAREFAINRVNSFNTFLALSVRHKKKATLFASSVIFLGPNEIRCHNDLRTLKEHDLTLQDAETQFLDTWNSLQGNENAKDHAHLLINPPKPPNKLKTLNRVALFVSHNLANGLCTSRQTARSPEQDRPRPRRRLAAGKTIRKQSVSSASTTRSLVRTPALGSQATVEAAMTAWRETTAAGKQELLDEERPKRLVVQEKKTHPHEMETVLVR